MTATKLRAEKLARWRDDGVGCATFWVGGADGVSQSVKDNADEKLALGRQTWPHRLVRVMISEQIYRAVTILSGNPYHRD
ncbi:MAG: 23S rRNA (pseudouridine(1915)-N(3))-methyltransferase RlmH [Proteobacteria bacterium]|nr:23S rRNA (pseudouridine(1915)-N(3))-methyltransferase RlmH [Pseudomonadota bacterium]